MQHRHARVLIGMGVFDRLELNTETLRDLTGDELTQVAGGAVTTKDTLTMLGGETGTFLCPSGRTWTANCQSWACD